MTLLMTPDFRLNPRPAAIDSMTGNLPVAQPGTEVMGHVPGLGIQPRATNPLLRYLGAVRRFKWLILLLTAVGLGGGYLASKLRPATYTVTAEVLIADPHSDDTPYAGAPLYTGNALKEFFYSYPVLTPVAIDRKLYIIGPTRLGGPPQPAGPSGPDAGLFDGFSIDEDRLIPGSYEFKVNRDGSQWDLTDSKTGRHEHGAAGDSAGRALGFLWAPRIVPRWDGQTLSFTVLTPREAADDIIKHLHVEMAGMNARLMHVSLDGTNGDRLATTLNAILDQFVALEGSSKRIMLTTQVQSLDSQLTEANAKLRDAEQALQAYRVNTITLPREDLPVAPGLSNTSNQGYASFVDERNQRELLAHDRDDLAAALAKADSGNLVVDLFMAIPTVQQRPELTDVLKELGTLQAQLRTAELKYSDSCSECAVDMPRLIAQINEVRTKTIPTYARVVLRQLDGQIARLDGEIATSSTELKGIPNRSITEARLSRDLSTEADIVESLTKSYQAKKLEEGAAVNDVSVFARAVAPLRPTSNRALVLVGLGLIAGLVLGLALTFLLDLIDKRVRYADQITSGMGLTILGAIPEIKRAKGEVASAEEAAQVIEAFRTVRLNLMHSLRDGMLAVTISSPSPGDGKSLVSANLALSFAEAGYRTVLVDGDTRRGELHRTFGVNRRPGLLDFLTGELGQSELLRPTTHPKLQLITGGSRKRNAPELLGGMTMRKLVASLREQFEVVIIDSPPLGAGIDPFVLGTITGEMLLVVRAGATERDLAEAKLQIVDQLPIHLVGAVLNDVRASMSEYRYYSYSAGYGTVEEASETPKLNAQNASTP